jgi:hypothetical protein
MAKQSSSVGGWVVFFDTRYHSDTPGANTGFKVGSEPACILGEPDGCDMSTAAAKITSRLAERISRMRCLLGLSFEECVTLPSTREGVCFPPSLLVEFSFPRLYFFGVLFTPRLKILVLKGLRNVLGPMSLGPNVQRRHT